MSKFQVHPEYKLVNISFEIQPQSYQSESIEEKSLQQKKPIQSESINSISSAQDNTKENEEATAPLDILFPYVK